MADTRFLHKIEEKLVQAFWRKIGGKPIALSRTQSHKIFLGMEPDAIGWDRRNRTLIVAEVTTSGYLGSSRGNFHIGATRKLAEAFCKLALIKHAKNRRKMLSGIQDIAGRKPQRIECYFIVPKGAAFLKALGYRNFLLDPGGIGVATLFEAPLGRMDKKQLIMVLKAASEEIGRGKRKAKRTGVSR